MVHGGRNLILNPARPIRYTQKDRIGAICNPTTDNGTTNEVAAYVPSLFFSFFLSP